MTRLEKPGNPAHAHPNIRSSALPLLLFWFFNLLARGTMQQLVVGQLRTIDKLGIDEINAKRT